MKITFLGTSSGAPTRTRNVTSIALQFTDTGALWLFDCGEGTQHQVLRTPLRLSRLERVFITHLHGDHLFGLPGLLASRSLQSGGVAPVTVHGPPDLRPFLQTALERSGTHLGYPLAIERVTPGVVFENTTLKVVCAPMRHGREAYGYAIVEKERPGHFDAARAAALGVPAGPFYGRLKSGETLTLPNGRVISGSHLVGPPQPGRTVVFCGDTTYTPDAVALALDADVLIHEATYRDEDADLAARAEHSTAAVAARVAREASAQALILTHFSPRYEGEAGSQMQALGAEARAIFPNTLLAEDFWSYTVPRRAPSEQDR